MDEHKDVPYIVHEGMMARMERIIKRLWILCILLILLLVGTNAGWLYFESQFEMVESSTQDVNQDVNTGEGSANVTGIGDIYGEDTSDSSTE